MQAWVISATRPYHFCYPLPPGSGFFFGHGFVLPDGLAAGGCNLLLADVPLPSWSTGRSVDQLACGIEERMVCAKVTDHRRVADQAMGGIPLMQQVAGRLHAKPRGRLRIEIERDLMRATGEPSGSWRLRLANAD